MTFTEAFVRLQDGEDIRRVSAPGRTVFVAGGTVYVDVGRARVLWLFSFEDFNATDWELV